MRTLKGFLYLILGGTLCGWMFNRIAAWFIDNPLTVGSNHTVAEWAVILQDPFYLDSRTMPFFFLAFGAIALVAMTKYDWTGEREEQKKLRGEEYGNQRWARDDEMQQFAHTSTVKRVPIRIPQRTADAMRFARNNPKDFIKAKLGMTNKVANPKPDYVEKIEDDNIILSERAELQMSKIPDPALERNKHVYVLGGSGSGKTFNFVGPNLLQLNSSIVTTDPKGDTLKQYGNFFLRHGYKLKVVNTKPDQINQSMHYNPLLYLQDSTSIMQIVNLLVENTSGNAEAEKEDFFVKAERQLYMALMGYLFYFYADQPQYQTFPQMLDLLQLAGKDNPSQTKTPLDIIMLGTTAEDGFQGFEEWIVANHGGDEAAAQASEEYFVIKQYKGFKSTSGSPETEASVIASCNVRLAPFAVSAVREFFSEDELELEMIGEERTAFFLVMSDTDKTFNFILAMLLYQLFDVNTAIADRNPGLALQDPDQLHPRRARQHRPHPRPRRQDRDPALALDLHHGHPAIGHAAQEDVQGQRRHHRGQLRHDAVPRPLRPRDQQEDLRAPGQVHRHRPQPQRVARPAGIVVREREQDRQGAHGRRRPRQQPREVRRRRLHRLREERLPVPRQEVQDDRPPALPRAARGRRVQPGRLELGPQVRARARAPRRGRGDALAHRGGPFVLRPRVLHVGGPRRGRPSRSTYLTRRGGSNRAPRPHGRRRDNRRENPIWLSSTSS